MAVMNVEVMEFSLSLVEEGHINLSDASVMIKSQGVGRLLRDAVSLHAYGSSAGLRLLRCLELSDTEVGNNGLRHLSGLTNLESLNLSFTVVTDGGLKKLSGLSSLKSLNLDSRNVTDVGLASLTMSPFSKLGKKGDTPAGSCIVSFVPRQSEFTLVLLDADTASPSFLPSWILLPTVLCFGMLDWIDSFGSFWSTYNRFWNKLSAEYVQFNL
ncbi:hypothetical protein C3L33_14549, partial [Rhododendron williamsianum]